MIDPKELKAKRQRKGLSIFDIADAISLDPMTVAAVEAGDLKAMEPLLIEWERIIERSPARPWLVRLVQWITRQNVVFGGVL